MVPYILAEFEVILYASPVLAVRVAEEEEEEEVLELLDEIVSALTTAAAVCSETSWLALFKLNQSQKLACAVPADKKTAINTAKKPMKTIFLNFNILFINILTINAKQKHATKVVNLIIFFLF